MSRVIASVGLVLALVGCARRELPTTGPTLENRPTIESIGPPGDVCFPTRQPDNRSEPSGSSLATTLPTTRPAS